MSENLPRDPSRDQHVLAFLQSKGVSFACPACGSNDSEIDEAENYQPAIGYHAQISGIKYAEAVLPIYVVKCKNCGFVRCFDREIVGPGR